jgi:hypothetical protein
MYKLRRLPLLLAVVLCTATGCGGLSLVPVKGMVKLGDKPFTVGGVMFIPDASKGNTAHVACSGWLGADGRFELRTAGVEASQVGTGAPLGWYKVTYIDRRDTAAVKVPARYLRAETTPWSVEVVADPQPDRYHFTLEK